MLDVVSLRTILVISVRSPDLGGQHGGRDSKDGTNVAVLSPFGFNVLYILHFHGQDVLTRKSNHRQIA